MWAMIVKEFRQVRRDRRTAPMRTPPYRARPCPVRTRVLDGAPRAATAQVPGVQAQGVQAARSVPAVLVRSGCCGCHSYHCDSCSHCARG